jgi:hypothetical protein
MYNQRHPFSSYPSQVYQSYACDSEFKGSKIFIKKGAKYFAQVEKPDPSATYFVICVFLANHAQQTSNLWTLSPANQNSEIAYPGTILTQKI